jgi:Ca2+-binding EF-hand superfamily protein
VVIPIGREAFEFFSSSGLDTAVLRSIWFLADVNKDTKLDAEEFAIALHLIRKIRGGSPLPATLPEALRISASPAAAVAALSSPSSLSFGGAAAVASPLSQPQMMSSYASSPASSPIQSTPTASSLPSSQRGGISSLSHQSALDLLSPGPVSAGTPHDAFAGMNPNKQSSANDDPLDLLPRADDAKVELEPLRAAAPSPRVTSPIVANTAAPLSQGSITPVAATAAIAVDGWNMSHAEKTAYLSQFASADKDHDGYVSGREAFEFFTSSGLSADVLRGIWYLADIDKDNRLDAEEFAIATHLVRKARGGAAVPATLPESLRPLSHGVAAATAIAGLNFSSPVSAISSPPPVSELHPSVEVDHHDEWSISAAERAGYLAQFATVDKDHDGYVSGREAFEFFTSSGLEANILRGIWTLADYGKDNRLDPAEFAIAVHLVRKVRGGAILPSSLPSSLVPVATHAGAPISGGQPVSSPPASATGGLLGDSADPWAMSAQERAAYLAQFPTTDKDGDGYVSGIYILLIHRLMSSSLY